MSYVYVIATHFIQVAPSVNEPPQLSSTGGQTPATAPGATVPTGAMPEPVLSHGKSQPFFVCIICPLTQHHSSSR